MDAIAALTTRRSVPKLTDPAPDDRALETLLKAGMNAPDHGRLRPWRFLVLRGDARRQFGDLLAEALRRRDPSATADQIEGERRKPLRAPLIVIVSATVTTPHKVPILEQIVAVGAATQNVVLAAHALGFATMWRTGAPAYDTTVKTALGLASEDTIIGFLYLGTAAGEPPIVPPSDPADFVRHWPE
jgi:nitroreductase